jgi:hypothetical protein
VTLFGVRLGVWLAASGLAAGALAFWLAAAPPGPSDREGVPARASAGRPERVAAEALGRGSRIRVGAVELGGAGLGARAGFEGTLLNGHAAASPSAAGAGGVRAAVAAEPGTSPAELAAAPPAPPRPPEVVSLEREALRSLSALPREDADALAAEIEAELAVLEPEPGESPRAFEERREDARGRLVSDELLLRARLAELYAQQVYPHGFPAERIVASMERQLVQALPAVDRAAALRQLAEGRPPARPPPRFESPASGLIYRGGPGL